MWRSGWSARSSARAARGPHRSSIASVRIENFAIVGRAKRDRMWGVWGATGERRGGKRRREAKRKRSGLSVQRCNRMSAGFEVGAGVGAGVGLGGAVASGAGFAVLGACV